MNHLDFAAAESAALEPTNWERWISAAELLVGHTLDGDQAVYGYSYGFAYDSFEAGLSVAEYIASIRLLQQYQATHLKPGARIATPYGLAAITQAPDAEGVMEIKYSSGDTATLNVGTEVFQLAPSS